jgi:RNA polymerase sigma-70 factor (ECF subfamily)
VSRFGKQVASDVDPTPVTPVGGARDELSLLARAAVQGDADAAATLATHVAGPMLKVIRKALGRRHPDVDDVAQDALMAFLAALATFRGECRVVHFAQRIALLTTLAARRRARVRDHNSEAHGVHVVADGEAGASPLATTVASRRRELVRQLLDQLPEVIAEALALHFILGHTVDEIAEASGVSPNTVWSRLRLGKRALRRKLDADARLHEMLADREREGEGG